MSHMHPLFRALLIAAIGGLGNPDLGWAADNEPPEGFVSLFDGKSLAGWTVPEGDNGHWKVVDGVIDYDAQSEAKGDKNLWSRREYEDFVLRVDWRLKETPYINPNVPYVLPDGSHAHDTHGKELHMALPDADSGVFLRGSGKYQANIFCWPIGSGELYGVRTDSKMPPEVRAAATPRTQADKPVGQWNRFEITVRGSTIKVVLNGKTVIPGAEIPGLPQRGRIALQHHGAKRDGKWVGPPSLVQFKNIYIKELKPIKKAQKWRALHLLGYGSDQDLELLGRQVPQLAELGVNVLILEVDYNFRFKSHPELRAGRDPITRQGARKFAALCRRHGIRVIPQFQCLGHQSWRQRTGPLLTTYPDLDLTPGAFPKNKGIYCREWDPLNPKVNRIVFPLLDEIIDAFQADALHVGMDEVFLLGSEKSPSTKGKDPAKVFAKAVNDLHRHLVKERQVEMLMWGDRLIDAKKFHWGEWEASKNGTAAAVDLIPKDIIICPWHYERSKAYPSIPMFLDKGFRVLPGGWRKLDASRALIEYCGKLDSPKLLGHLFTTWGAARKNTVAEFRPLVEGLKLLKPAGR
jgi:hypothetical protein